MSRSNSRGARVTRVARGLLAASLLASCALNPVTGTPEVSLISEETEAKAGAEAAREIETSIGIVEDGPLTAYVAQVGERVAAHSPRKGIRYRFQVVDESEPNAFALPGGYVYVSRGILALLNGEDELACILGHEVAHVAARHAAQRISKVGPLSVLTAIPGAVTGIVFPRIGALVGGVGSLASEAISAPYSRSQESDADRIGQQMAAAAGYDPGALARAFDTMGREELTRGSQRRPSWFDSHPASAERAKESVAFARTLTRAAGTPIAASRNDFVDHFDGLVVGDPASKGVFSGRTFLHPDLDFHVRFPEGWKTENSPSAILATAKPGDAAAIVRIVAESDDPMAGARALEARANAPVVRETKAVTVGGRKAARADIRARTDDGPVSAYLTWIAYRGRVYEIAGIASPDRAPAMRGVFDDVAESFGPLDPSERASIREDRLRLVTARASETAQALVDRARSSWSPSYVAMANRLGSSAPVAGGERIKVAVTEPYRGSATGKPGAHE
ncbi:MAG: M48 family metalloprotease [Deltaproteobacteria bacterium]|nr:M48 family metalloprotease [Deltaproteobacteria bacterium]